MAKYVLRINKLLSRLENYEIKKIPRAKNEEADKLEKMASSMEHANINHQPTTLLQPLESPLTFAQWDMNVVGPIPPAFVQRKILIIAVDYFTKFRIPRAFVSDNGTQFSGSKLKEWSQKFSIEKFFTSLGNPLANGQTKAKPKGNGWTSFLVSYGPIGRLHEHPWESPFNLVYGVEAVAPAEIGEPSLRVQQYLSIENEQAMRLSLDLIDELREEASLRAEKCRAMMTKAYNNKVKHMPFQVGYLVLRKVNVLRPIGKLDPKWEGPYKYIEIVRREVYRLQQPNKKLLPRTWNIANLNKFYV
ncbi:uncharacterized protein [Henckelia pumila]|uniref:uncharacterized protein n=1 Tax=Henckelia pumila TaxID=405737 RepID=UPI003C6DF9E3